MEQDLTQVCIPERDLQLELYWSLLFKVIEDMQHTSRYHGKKPKMRTTKSPCGLYHLVLIKPWSLLQENADNMHCIGFFGLILYKSEILI